MLNVYEVAFEEIDEMIDHALEGESVEVELDEMDFEPGPRRPSQEFIHNNEGLEVGPDFAVWELVHREMLDEVNLDQQWDEMLEKAAERMWPKLPISAC